MLMMFDIMRSSVRGLPNTMAGHAGDLSVSSADSTTSWVMLAFTAIAWYNSIETLVLIFIYFKNYKGLYFWSLLLSTTAVLPYATGAWLKQHEISHNHRLDEILLIVGWLVMVPGQSLVLYSRLHIISQDFVLSRFILWLIIFNAIVLCIPTVILDSLQFSSDHLFNYYSSYFIMEKIEMCIFTAQEVFISSIYLWEVWKLLKMRRILDSKTRKSTWQLLAMNIVHLAMDLSLLTVEFMKLYRIQTTLKGLVYSVKLKIEFAVLNQIVDTVRNRNASNSVSLVIPKSEEGGQVVEIVPGRISVGYDSNLPREWRLESGISRIVSPNMRAGDTDGVVKSPTDSIGSVGRMYPGRLGQGL